MNMSLISLSAGDLQFLSMLTIIMILALAAVGAAAIIFSDGGYKLKVAFYLAVSMLISGISFLVVPPLVGGILKG
jgi:archaellum biogenesis protein FlaJ (TadC family)